MRTLKNGLVAAAREHLLDGNPITRLEAVVLFGVQNLPSVIKDMKRQGWTINTRKVSYAAVARRINQFAQFVPPQNLPVNEIEMMEYWVSK